MIGMTFGKPRPVTPLSSFPLKDFRNVLVALMAASFIAKVTGIDGRKKRSKKSKKHLTKRKRKTIIGTGRGMDSGRHKRR